MLDWKKIPKLLEELDAYWNCLLQHNKIKMKSIATTFENQNVNLVTIEGPESSNKKRKSIFVSCGQHAREWIAHNVCPYLAHHWISNPELIQGFTVYIIPMMNPDGYKYSYTVNRMKRYNRQPSGSWIDGTGVDLNRTWKTNWKKLDDPTFNGNQPFDAIETKKTQEFLISHLHSEVTEGSKNDIQFAVDIHSLTDMNRFMILYPPGVKGKVPKATEYKETLKDLSNIMKNKIDEYAKNNLPFGPEPTLVGTPGEILYDAPGTIFDTTVQEDWIICSLGIEVPAESAINEFPHERKDGFNEHSVWKADIVANVLAQGFDDILNELRQGKCDVQEEEFENAILY